MKMIIEALYISRVALLNSTTISPFLSRFLQIRYDFQIELEHLLIWVSSVIIAVSGTISPLIWISPLLKIHIKFNSFIVIFGARGNAFQYLILRIQITKENCITDIEYQDV
ncbi:hypothetical protein L6452_00818 [Arctium lappa]|uniref:Uncharacterized protein n=1 Tax=Arctium lappa TaxID=4217 RepID=A0ACB9FG79_ARCLA|nr:hypothetical protein L6452_00818 [Arctium lappa]